MRSGERDYERWRSAILMTLSKGRISSLESERGDEDDEDDESGNHNHKSNNCNNNNHNDIISFVVSCQTCITQHQV